MKNETGSGLRVGSKDDVGIHVAAAAVGHTNHEEDGYFLLKREWV